MIEGDLNEVRSDTSRHLVDGCDPECRTSRVCVASLGREKGIEHSVKVVYSR